MRILLTNDDGITAPGMLALYEAARDLGEVHVVAPATVKSAMSHAVTFHKALIAQRQRLGGNGNAEVPQGWAVDGTPADCIKLATGTDLCPGPYDLVISGINSGANIGVNVLYSGTVAAAREASIQGIPAIAVSLHIGDPRKTRWTMASEWTTRVLRHLLAGPLHPDVLLNINIPILDEGVAPQGVRVLPVNRSPISDNYEEQAAATQGTRQFQAASHLAFRRWPPDPKTDVEALFQRFVTISPLQFDLTHHEALQRWETHFERDESAPEKA